MTAKNDMPEYGKLPEQGLLGAAYVPMQKQDCPRYDTEEGIKNGTLFPGLNLPYGRFVPNKEVANTPKGQLMALSFALDELALYLDTHPGDKEALELRNGYVRLHDEAMTKYQKEHGPVTKNVTMKDGYTWINNPWPWE